MDKTKLFYIFAVLAVSRDGEFYYYVFTNAGCSIYRPLARSKLPVMIERYIENNIARAVHVTPSVVLITDRGVSFG